MEIRYYSYTEEIIDNINPGMIHLFDKSVDKQEAKKRYRGDIFDDQPLFMTLGEFKGSLFLSDKIAIKEEKQVIAFYKALSPEHRKRLKVEGYYDVIDMAANFFNFFRMMIEYRLEGVENLKDWQRGIYDLFSNIRENYLNLLENRNYTDSVFIGVEENFQRDIYNRYKEKEIVIYNKLYFTPREKWIVEELEKEGYRFLLKLQLKKGDFCEDTLKLKRVTYEEESKRTLNVYRAEDEFTALLKLLEVTRAKEKAGEEFSIYDANNDNFKYNTFFNEVVFLSEISIFKLIECIHILVAGLEVDGYADLKGVEARAQERSRVEEKAVREIIQDILKEKLLIGVKDLMKVVEIEEFRRYYRLDERDITLIRYLVGEGYKFITHREVERLVQRLDESEKETKFTGEDFIKIFEVIGDTIECYQMNTLKKWCEKLTFTKEVMEAFSSQGSNEINKYFEALSEVEIIEELELIETDDKGEKRWDSFFNSSVSEGLLRLIMKYHRFKEVASNGHKLKKTALSELPTVHEKIKIFLNISDVFVPENKGSSFLLTEAQRKELGIKDTDDDRLLEKYNLLRGIMTSEEIHIITVEDQDRMSLSPFIEEIIGEGVSDVRIGIDTDNYLQLVKEVIPQGQVKEVESAPEDKELILDREELLKKRRISAYMCDELFNCQYKMYLRYVAGLDREEVVVDEGLTRREYGNLAHSIFEEVLIRYIKEPRKFEPLQGQVIDVRKIYEIVERLIEQPGRKLKLPNLNSKYYREIIYKNLAEGVKRFFQVISKELDGKNVVDIHVEEYGYKEITGGMYQSAKGDLIIDTDSGRYIVDFKTGGKIDRQLDYYCILYTGRSDGAEKYIYSIDKNVLEKAEKLVMTKEQLINQVDELLEGKTYERNYTSRCKRCEYWVVCKEVEKNV